MPDNSVFYVTEVCVPHAWYTIENNMNNKFYIRVIFDTVNNDLILTLDSKNMTGADLAVEILTQLNKIAIFNNKFTITYDSARHLIYITCDFSYSFMVLTKTDIATKLNNTWNGVDYNVSKPSDVNTNMLRQNEGLSALYSNANIFVSGCLDLQPIRNIYLSSPNLGNFNTLGPRGQASIIKKVPVSSNYNEMIFDNMMSTNDFLDCSKQTLKNIEFTLSDVHGERINLHGQEVSFSIIFDLINKNS